MDYFTRWLFVVSGGFLLLLCALVIRFFRIRSERKHQR